MSNDLTRHNNSNIAAPQSLDDIAADIGVPVEKLYGIPKPRYADILYPFKAYAIYYLTRFGRYISGAEEKCNELIGEFMKEQLARYGAEQYSAAYKNATTHRSQKLVMLRVLVATFEFGRNQMDYLPRERRFLACNFLNVSQDITLPQAMDLIEAESKEANAEELILGRLGYLMMWRSIAGDDYKPEIKPSEDSVVVERRRPQDSRGVPIDRSILDDWGLEDKDKEIVITDENDNILGPEEKPKMPDVDPTIREAPPAPGTWGPTGKQVPVIAGGKLKSGGWTLPPPPEPSKISAKPIPLIRTNLTDDPRTSGKSPPKHNHESPVALEIRETLQWRGFRFIPESNIWIGPKDFVLQNYRVQGLIADHCGLTHPRTVSFLKSLDQDVAAKGW